MEITFIPNNPQVQDLFGLPKPAKKSLPNWYKEQKTYYQEGDKMGGLNINDVSSPNTTIKACMPFFDALTAGYVWELPVDLELRKVEDIIEIKWRYGSSNMVSTHTRVQVEKMPEPLPSKNKQVFKFLFEYRIKTPKGYSTLFTHPLNNHDLPFRTFSGIVDTDLYQIAVQFPFVVHADFGKHLIIPKGTPVIQFIPFKRDTWTHKVENWNTDTLEKEDYKLFSKIQHAYKRNFWQRKSYE